MSTDTFPVTVTQSTEVSDDVAKARYLLSSRLNDGIGLLADRDDLVLTCAWDAPQGTPPAYFHPKTCTVTLNATLALGGEDPAVVNPLTPDGRRRHPVVVGLCCHEASHAHSTLWGDTFGQGHPSNVVKAAVLLEEPRIEARQIERRPHDRLYLRAQSVFLDLPGAGTPGKDRWRAGTGALLVLGRVDAGVLDREDVADVLPQITEAVGVDVLGRLRAIWQAAIDLDDGDVDGLLELGRQWVEALDVADEDLPDTGCSSSAGNGEAAESSGSGDAGESQVNGQDGEAGDSAEDADDEWDDPLADALRDAMQAVSEAAEDEAADEVTAGTPDGYSEAASEAKQKAAEQEVAKDAAKVVFHGYSEGGTRHPLRPGRAPTAQERTLARRIGEALRRAQFRERSATVVSSQTPPGRLQGREAMFGAAQRARRAPVTAAPFRTVVRKHSPEPPLSLGIAVDVSGSMQWATNMMATMAWVCAHAATYVQGRSATVVFGDRTTAVTRPGAPPTKVTPFVADAGSEDFSGAVTALDGALSLAHGRGARLLFVVSDGHFVRPGEPEKAQKAVTRLTKSGVGVLWFDTTTDTIVPDGAVRVEVSDVTTIPNLISKALTETLRSH